MEKKELKTVGDLRHYLNVLMLLDKERTTFHHTNSRDCNDDELDVEDDQGNKFRITMKKL